MNVDRTLVDPTLVVESSKARPFVSVCRNSKETHPYRPAIHPNILAIRHHAGPTLSAPYTMRMLNVPVCLATSKVQIQLEAAWKNVINATPIRVVSVLFVILIERLAVSAQKIL